MINETQIEDRLRSMFDKPQFPDSPAGLYDPLRYMIGIGGKRVRPRLCLTTYALFKDEFTESIIQPAIAVEVFHSFTLIHDDIMDKAAVRRGVPTVWRKWNNNTAILSGDVMSIDSFHRLSFAPPEVLSQVMELFTSTASAVCEGQQYDMDFENLPEISMDRYMSMIGLKTAVLIACSAKLGALIAGAGQKECDLLYEFGYALGLAFQIADDYLDTFGDPEIFGKTIGGDILNNKKTWLLTKAMEKADMSGNTNNPEKRVSGQFGYDRTALQDALCLPMETEAEKATKIEKIKEIYTKFGVDEDAKYEIIRLHAKALDYASQIGLTRIRYEMLSRYAEKLIGRTK